MTALYILATIGALSIACAALILLRCVVVVVAEWVGKRQVQP